MLGRRPEKDAIAALLARAAAGSGGALMLHGELGIGKTALLDWAAAHADTFIVVSVAAQQAESAMPSAALHRLLHPLIDEVSGPSADDALALADAIYAGRALRDRLAARRGQVIEASWMKHQDKVPLLRSLAREWQARD